MLMRTRPWNPLAELESFGREIERAFGATERTGGSASRWNVYDGDDAVTLTAELPGFDPEKFEVELTGDRLTVAGGREVARDAAAREVLRERGDASFREAFTLGFAPEADAVDAEYRHGVLAVTVAKPAAEQPQKITVRV